MNATYEFFKQDYANPDAVQAEHRKAVRERCSKPGLYLLIADTSDISYSGREPVAGLAPAGSGKSPKSQAFKLHSLLAVRVPDGGLLRNGSHHPTLSLCGLLHQTYTLRQPREEKHVRRFPHLKGQWLETDLWADAVKAVGEAPSDEDNRWVYVADRGADILDHILTIKEQGAGFVIRAKHDRRVHVDEREPKATGKLLDELREKPSLGTMNLELRARPGKSARTVELHLSAISGIVVQSPQAPGRGKNSGEKVTLNTVRVWEEASGEQEPVEWILLTDSPVDTADQVREISLIYSCRWLVEEFHKALKSGMAAEKLQLEEGKRLMSAVSIMSIVALRLLDLRDSVRLEPDAPASERGFDEVDLQILTATRGKPIATIKDAVWAVARLGGFPGRKGDGHPGMTVLWRGMTELLIMKAGWLLALKMNRSGPPSP